MQLHFLGANRQVTGSRYFLRAGGLGLLIDCGMFQERPFLSRNWEPCPIQHNEIDMLLLTHAHLDHCGLIPKLVKEGYRKPILATPPTIDLTRIVLQDAAKIQEEDAEYKKKRHAREGRPSDGPQSEQALYTLEDADRALALLKPVALDQPVQLNQNVTVTYHFAGHILGSAIIEIAVNENGQTRTIVFSGDIGQWDRPVIKDPDLLSRADYVVMESTYGDRVHDHSVPVPDALEEVINDTFKRGGNIIVPTFALERPQELLFHLNTLINSKRIPPIVVFLDSPMAVDAHQVFYTYQDELDAQTQAMLKAGDDPLDFPGLKLTRSARSSKAINGIRGTCMIMAGSGMCTGGRVKHHLVQNLPRPESTILFVGYQAQHTLGRQILEKQPTVRIFGETRQVKARICKINGLSAHGDRNDLLRWLDGFNPAPKHLFLTHGEEHVAMAFADEIARTRKLNVSVPEYKSIVELK
jgi:metallo-beta-lactamase family protein